MLRKIVEQKIRSLIADTLGLKGLEVDLSHPLEEKFGDLSTNLPLRATKALNQSPQEIAKNLLDILYKSDLSAWMEKIEIAGPGFINFFVKPEILVKEVNKVVQEGSNYGRGQLLKDKKMMIEFAHPNTHKEFHIGHLRNISLGESLVRLNEALGAEVIRVNYQGDVGLHVAKALWGVKHLGLPDEKKPLLERVKFLGKAYVEGNKASEAGNAEVAEINRKIYAREPEITDLWQKTRSWSLDYFDSIYKRLGTHYDRLFFESEVDARGAQISQEALEPGILKRSEGAVIFDGTPYGLDKRVFLTKENLPTYEAKELGLAELEFSEFGPIDQCLHVVGPEQQSFFKVTFKVEELIDPQKFKGRQRHFVYGYVQLKEGKMSSRQGNVVAALSIIEAAKAEIKKMIKLPDLSDPEREEIAEKVAVGAVKYSLLKTDAKNDIAFDLGQSVSLEGNSGPYLQYTYARARSVLRKSQITSHKSQTNQKFQSQKNGLENLNFDIVWNLDFGAWDFVPEELSLLRTLYKFPEVVEAAGLSLSPHLICNFLFDLAQKFNLFYNNVPILTDELPTTNNQQLTTRQLRLLLTAATAQILKNGLDLLGIEAPERM